MCIYLVILVCWGIALINDVMTYLRVLILVRTRVRPD